MKTISLIALLALSSAAFANPFAAFVGKYRPANNPQVAMKGYKYCDYQGFREMTALTILQQPDGDFRADLDSKLDNSDMTSATVFSEFTYAGDFAKNTARISGDANSAIYEMVDQGSHSMDSFIWSISKSAASFHLRISVLTSDPLMPAGESCVYDVDLEKVK